MNANSDNATTHVISEFAHNPVDFSLYIVFIILDCQLWVIDKPLFVCRICSPGTTGLTVSFFTRDLRRQATPLNSHHISLQTRSSQYIFHFDNAM